MKKLYLLSIFIISIFCFLKLDVHASVEARNRNLSIDEIESYLNSTDEEHTGLFKVFFTDYRYTVEYSTGTTASKTENKLLIPVSTKVQVTNNLQTSIELNQYYQYNSLNLIAFRGLNDKNSDESEFNNNKGILPYYYLASDKMVKTNYLEKCDFSKNDYKDNPQNICRIDIGVTPGGSNFGYTPYIGKSSISTSVDCQGKIGQYAQMFIKGSYCTKYVRIKKEKRKVSGKYETLSSIDTLMYVFAISGYEINWTFE